MDTAIEPITIDALAAEKFEQFLDSAGGGGCLRLAVRGGGCSGFQYALAIDVEKDEDLVFESEGQTIVVDPTSYPYVAGARITYREELNGGGFDVENPKAVSACGCGNSFRVDPNATSCAPESAL